MFYKFSKSIFDDLIVNGFHILSGEASKKPYTDKTELIALEKQVGSNLYIVFIHNTLEYEMQKLIDELVKINEYLWHLPHIKNYKQVIIVNILPTSQNTFDNSEAINNLINTPSNIPDSFIYNIFWEVNVDTGEIKVGKNQPSKLLNIEKYVAKSVDNIKSNNVQVPTGNSIVDTYKETISNYISKKNISFKPPVATFFLIITMFILVIYTEFINPQALSSLAVSRQSVVNDKQVYRLFTSIFTHANLGHFLSNALGIYIFGVRIERAYGESNMIVTFMLSALIGNIATIQLMQNTVSVGASGGVFGLMGFALCITYFSNSIMLGFDFNTLAVMFVFMLLSSFAIPNVNYVAHIVGFIVGFTIAVYYCYLDRKNTEE